MHSVVLNMCAQLCFSECFSYIFTCNDEEITDTPTCIYGSGSHCPSLCLNPPHIRTYGKWGKPRAAVLKMAAKNTLH